MKETREQAAKRWEADRARIPDVNDLMAKRAEAKLESEKGKGKEK